MFFLHCSNDNTLPPRHGSRERFSSAASPATSPAPARHPRKTPSQHRPPALQLPTNTLKPFTGDNVLEWLEDVQDIAFGACKLTETEWMDRLPAFLDGEAKRLFRSTLRGLPWSSVAESLRVAFNSPMRQHRAQNELSTATQGTTESIIEFIGRVRALARGVDPLMSDNILRGYIQRGIRDSRLTVEFICGAATSIDSLTEQLAVRERALVEAPIPTSQVHAVEEADLALSAEFHRKCYRCGRLGHRGDECRRPRCRHCGKSGHEEYNCWYAAKRGHRNELQGHHHRERWVRGDNRDA